MLSKRFTVADLFGTGQFVSILKKQYARVNQQSHMYSLVILAPDNTYYELEIDAANELHSLLGCWGNLRSSRVPNVQRAEAAQEASADEHS